MPRTSSEVPQTSGKALAQMSGDVPKTSGEVPQTAKG